MGRRFKSKILDEFFRSAATRASTRSDKIAERRLKLHFVGNSLVSAWAFASARIFTLAWATTRPLTLAKAGALTFARTSTIRSKENTGERTDRGGLSGQRRVEVPSDIFKNT